MASINIDGIGRVEVGDEFTRLSPEEQAQAVDDIVATHGGSRDSGALGFLNRGIASAVGAPVDVMNWAASPVTKPLGLHSEQPLGGSRSLGAGMRAIDAEVARENEKPEGYAERAAEGVGLAAGSLLPGAGAVGAVSRAGGPMARGVAGEVARPFISTPGRAMAVEATAGAGAGAGGLAAESSADRLGLSPATARVVGELTGGLAAATAPGMAARAAGAAIRKAPLTGALVRAGRAALIPFTESGARVRASRRLRELSGAPAEDAAQITGDTLSGLTPAQETGNPRLMALERAILDQDAQLGREFKARSEEGTQALKGALREPAGTATAQDARAFVRQRQDYIRGLLEQRILQAQERAHQALADVTPALRETEASAIFRRELEKALKDARAQERELWASVPKDVTVPTTNAREAFETFRSQLGRAQQDDIPEEAVRFLDPDRNSAFKETESVRDVHSLYSKLRETARIARANGNVQKARIADGIAEATMRDLEASDVRRRPGALGDAEDAFRHQQDVDAFFERYDRLSRQVAGFAKRPVTGEIIRRGGVDPQSPLAAELRHLGITSRTHPGLYRKGGLRDVDNLPLSEIEGAAEIGIRDEGGYASRQDILDTIADEARREPRLTAEQRQMAEELAELERQMPQYERFREDIGATGRVERPFPGDFTDAEVSDPLAAARAYSRQLNQTFRQGRVGDILGREREGGASVPPEMTLGQTIGTGGARGAVAADELRRATEGSADAESAMRDYLRRRFIDYAAPRGELRPERARDFLRDNAELLDRFPDLRRGVETAAQAGQEAQRAGRADKGRIARLENPRRSVGAAFAEAPYAREFQAVLQARDPRTAARELKRQLAKDQTGQAARGLKASALDHLIGRARTAEGGVNAQTLRAALSDPRTRGALGEILEPEELARFGRVVTEFEKMAQSAGRLPDVGDVMQDTPSTVISFLGRTLGARAGAQAGAGTSGASLLTAHFASKRVKDLLHNLTNDRAAMLLRDAIQDPGLFKALLISADRPETARQVERRLVEWLAAQSGQTMNDLLGDEPESKGRRGERRHGARDSIVRALAGRPSQPRGSDTVTRALAAPALADPFKGNIAAALAHRKPRRAGAGP